MDRTLNSAIGKALAIVAALLYRGGVATPGEFGDLLGALANAVAATEPRQSQILASWSAAIRGVGDSRDVTRATGEVLAVVAKLLDRGEIIKSGEFGDLIGLFAVLTTESEPGVGELLAYWAAVVKDSASFNPSAPPLPH